MKATEEQIKELATKFYEASKAGYTYNLSENICKFFDISTFCKVMAEAQELAEKEGRTFDIPLFTLIQKTEE